jgi:hypothetical protein
MYLIGITVCVDYSDYLAATIDSKLQCCDTVIVATVDSDSATRQLVESIRKKSRLNDFKVVDCVLPNAIISSNKATFNKSAIVWEAQDLAYRLCHAESIKNSAFLLVDADIVLPENTRQVIEEHATDPATLYGARRRDFVTPKDYQSQSSISIPHYRKEPRFALAGYFQLYFEQKYYPKNSTTCAKCDDIFRDGFAKKVIMPLIVDHIGPERVNWKGRVSEPWVS